MLTSFIETTINFDLLMTPPITEASREIYWNVSGIETQVVMYLLFAVALGIFSVGMFERVKLWSGGGKDSALLSDWGKRIEVFFTQVLGQARVNRDRAARVFHMMIFWGFLALTFTTTMVFIEYDLGIKIYRGRYYLFVTMLSDIFGFLLLCGIFYAYHRRFIRPVKRIHNSRADFFMLAMLALLVAQGFVLEALRIAATDDPWKYYSPIGYAVSLLFWPLSESAMRVIHFGMWWFHAVTFFVFLALLPYTKFLHIFSSSGSLFFQRLGERKTALRSPGDIEKLMEVALEDGAEDFRIGISTVEDLSWKQRLELDACTSCGRCQEVCPAYNSGKILSPKWLILDTRDHMLTLAANGALQESSVDGFASMLDRSLLKSFQQPQTQVPFNTSQTEQTFRAENPLVQRAALSVGVSKNAKLAGEVMEEDVFWSCTTCRACVEVCPVGIEHVDYILDTRRSLALMEGNIPAEAQASLRAIETRGNPFGGEDARSDWASGLNVPFLKPGDSVEVLYWVGCVSAYDKRKQAIARSMVQILNASGLQWGILGNKESCTGDPARRLGEENLFQSQAKKNLETLGGVTFQTLVANCPHCFHTLKNEYPDFGTLSTSGEIKVVHHTHFIQELLEKKQLQLSKKLDDDFTFHDPCYLGRYNDTYQEPRDILVTIGSKQPMEMASNKNKGMCCGAGGGHFWFDMKVGERVNVQRVNQASATGASTVATGCPFCLQMMEDGVKLTDRESELVVRDIAELVADCI